MTTNEAVGFLFFPVGVIVGFAVAWRREAFGGLITLGSLALFYVWMFNRDGRFPSGPYFFLFAAPGLLHVVSALIAGRRSRAGGIAPPIKIPGGSSGRAS